MRVYRADHEWLAVGISADDARRWSTRPGSAWPCRTIRKPIRVDLDQNGDVVDVQPRRDMDARELTAMLSDLLSDAGRAKWRTRDQRYWLNTYASSQRSRL